jgi:dipicolinate synthase subunit A
MLEKKKIYVIGGDLRQIKLAEELEKSGFDVSIFGFENYPGEFLHPPTQKIEKINDYHIIVLPLPVSIDGETVSMPLSEHKVYLQDLFHTFNKAQKIFIGKVTPELLEMAQKYDITLHDYLQREEMAILNAIPTAEGAIQIALEEMPITLWDCKALILGYGRIGKVLSKNLAAMGSQVDVVSRKYADMAWVKTMGYKSITYGELEGRLPRYDVIFNTVPSKMLKRDQLEKVKKDCLIVDLASKPGGIDLNAASDLGIKTVWALSLPGKVAPVTAAAVIKETLLNMLKEMEV